MKFGEIHIDLQDDDLDFGDTDFAELADEDAIRKFAHALVPDCLRQCGEMLAERGWAQTQAQFKAAGIPLRSSPSEKRTFIRETSQSYVAEATEEMRRQLEDHIVYVLKLKKSQQDAK